VLLVLRNSSRRFVYSAVPTRTTKRPSPVRCVTKPTFPVPSPAAIFTASPTSARSAAGVSLSSLSASLPSLSELLLSGPRLADPAAAAAAFC
jgi:hypothetical protein